METHVRIGILAACTLLVGSLTACSSSTCGQELCVTVLNVECDKPDEPSAFVTLEIEARSKATKAVIYKKILVNQDTKETTDFDAVGPATPGTTPNKETIGFDGPVTITIVAVKSGAQIPTGRIYDPKEICSKPTQTV